MILVGNKTDLIDERKVSYERAKKAASDNGYKYFEASAAKNEGVDKFFNELIIIRCFAYRLVLNNNGICIF